jgi:DNA-binding SARP family transcriptional activator
VGQGWDIRLCGPVLVETESRRLDSGLPGRQGRLLFAYLVVNRARGCPRDELIDVLWPEGPPAAADSALSALLSKLRRALGDGVLLGRSELRLRLEGEVRVDIEASAAAIAEAEAALESGDPGLAGARARDALATDLQTFLPDADGGWAADQRRELDTIRLRALETLAEAGLRQGGRELGAAEQAAHAAIAAAPFRESAHRLLMEVHEAAGNPAEALRAFEELRSLLREELGTTPGPAAMAVFERVLRGEPPPVRRAPAPAVAAVPPGGLTATPWPAPLAAAVDRHALVGRDVELNYLGRVWREASDGQRALALLAGDAGIGKTRIAAELSARAHEEGATVLYGRFDEETLTPYQPVVEMLRGWSAGAPLWRSCCPSSARRRPTTPRWPPACPARRPTPSASASSTRWPRWSARSGPRRRWCWCSTTCTGRTGRRCSCCATSCARRRRAGRCSSAPTARARSPTAIRCTS